MRPPVIWDGQTDREEGGVVACLEQGEAFAMVAGVNTGTAVTVGTPTRSYLIAEGVLLQFARASSDIDRIFVRSDRPLTDVEKAGLIECAPYPDFPL